MKAWFLSLAPRERAIVAAGAAVLLLLVLWLWLWEPLARRVEELEQGVAVQEEDLAWMQQAAAEITQLRRSAGAGGTGGLQGRSLLAVVDQAARTAGLSGGLKRIEPEGQSRVRVQFEQIAFDDFMRWLDGMQRQYGVFTQTITIERGEAPGRVNIRLTLDAPA